MSVLIKGMKMPEEGQVFVVFVDRSKHYVLYNDIRYPLIEIPDHGDLIDRDELMKHGVYMPRDGGNLPVVYMSYVKGSKAVIPAERSEE